MDKLRSDDLMSLEGYASARDAYRARVMEHKRQRRLAVGPNLTLLFEDRLTMQYQIQEMLRAERIFEPQEIAAELAAYNPLIPDGDNWKATALIEYPDVAERQIKLRALGGIENLIWVRAAEYATIYAIADEDMVRGDEEKTSAVHFLRFQFDATMVKAVLAGADVRVGVNHDLYRHEVVIPTSIRKSLASDLRP